MLQRRHQRRSDLAFARGLGDEPLVALDLDAEVAAHRQPRAQVRGEAVGIGDVELLDCAVFLNGRPRRRVDDFGCGVSRLEERVSTCNENG